jgi:TRAP-type C4-dicarboxylate transport system permease small subunit
MNRLTRWLAGAAALALVVMVVAITIDVVSANLLHQPIRGVFDLVSALLVFVVFLGLPQTFLSQGNVTVDLIDRFLGRRGVLAFRAAAGALTVVFLVLLFWHMFQPALDAWRFGDRKPDLDVPIWIIWLPVLIGTGLALVAVIVLIGRALRGRDDGGAQAP